MDDEDPILASLRRSGLLCPRRPVVVLLSGGRDSTCLVHAAAAVAGPAAVRALHVNYGLRPGADGDEAFCRALCDELGVVLTVAAPLQPRRGNLQAWARAERYRAARELAEADGCDIATGHTADDQVETILLRLASAPSRRAILGMRPREGALVRPLLTLRRADTTAYCARHGLAFREDESNTGGPYLRGRVRHELIPLLRELHPAAEANLLRLADRLREEGETLDRLARAEHAGADGIELARLRALPAGIARLVVQQLADAALEGPAAGAGSRLEELLALGDGGTSALHIGHGLEAVNEYGRLRIHPIAAVPAPPAARLAIPGAARFGAATVRCEPAPPALAPGVVDRAALGEHLIVRAWREGDRMRPLGLAGTKTLGDLFTARRVPRRLRRTAAVVESAGEIVWVEGVAIADRCKVREGTRAAVRLTAERPYTPSP